ncbi:unnamed protein product [Diamesa serratosioi]
MSTINKMHPRNIYNNIPDFIKLAKNYPEFESFVKLDMSGKAKIDFKDHNTLRIFTKCCLHQDFNLKVTLPMNKLTPTLPLRLNYILWIEDLVDFAGLTTNVVGIDIGTGASCIYPLLAVRNNTHWKIVALELDVVNFNHAQQNIDMNNLQNEITLVLQHQNNSKIFNALLEKEKNTFTFCMCNPPFFRSEKDALQGKNRTGKRKAPKSLVVGSPLELVCDGGEYEFVKRIIDESLSLQEIIKIYSSMLGHKSTLVSLISYLKEQNINNYTSTVFSQTGKTMRWGLAWTYSKEFQLNTFKDHIAFQEKPSLSVRNILSYEIPNEKLSFESCIQKLKDIFTTLKIVIKIIETIDKKCLHWELSASENTWSNQRRKRRALMRDNLQLSHKPNSDFKLTLNLVLRAEETFSHLQLLYVSGNADKDCTNQILQYIKNKFNT